MEETPDVVTHFQYLFTNISKQQVEISKERQQYSLWKIKQLHTPPAEGSPPNREAQNSAFMKKQLLESLLRDIDANSAHIDHQLNELKEQQLCVDMSIEVFYSKIQYYPRGLKKLFDMGTPILSAIESFFSNWYAFQCDVQQKLYNALFSQGQELVLSGQQLGTHLKIIGKGMPQYHHLSLECCKIQGMCLQLQIEISAQGSALFKHSQQIF